MTVRTYRQTRRADATERTRAAILAAAQACFREDPLRDPSLEAIAARAEVSTRTVIRQFGSKEGLMEAAITAAMAETAAARHAKPGDVEGAVGKLIDHYEGSGDEVIRWLSFAAERLPVVRQVTERGTAMHLEWVEAVFAPDLDRLGRGERRARRAALATATDVYVWHLLRRRERLGREATQVAMLALVEGARGGGERATGTARPSGAPGPTRTARGAGARGR
jgi:AcrR family transcriptional regulator